MNVITSERVINAPVEKVWAVLTDLDRAPETLSGVSKIERVAGDGYEVGVRWRETRKVFGKEATEEMTVAEVEAPNRTVITADSRGVAYRTEFILAPSDGGTRITMVFSGVSGATGIKGLIEKILAPLGASVTRKMLNADLDGIARAAESR